jgi:hypothetical protein
MSMIGKINRKRPDTHVSLPKDVWDMLDELGGLAGWGRSRSIEECVRVAYPVIVKRLKETGVKPLLGKENKKPTPEDEERAREEYWRKVILGNLKDREWVSEWW